MPGPSMSLILLLRRVVPISKANDEIGRQPVRAELKKPKYAPLRASAFTIAMRPLAAILSRSVYGPTFMPYHAGVLPLVTGPPGSLWLVPDPDYCASFPPKSCVTMGPSSVTTRVLRPHQPGSAEKSP